MEESLDKCTDADKTEQITNINEMKSRELELNKIKTDGIILRSKVTTVEKGEKPTKYFLSLEKQKFLNKATTGLNKEGKLITDTKEIIQHVKSYYENLYTSKEVQDQDLERLLAKTNIPKLTKGDSNSLEGDLQYQEVLNALKNMKNEKSPGPSGFTTEFYKFFGEI